MQSAARSSSQTRKGDFMTQASTQYHSVKAAAQRYGLHQRMVYREIEAGRLKALKLGNPDSKRPTYRIADAALLEWEAALTIGAK